MSVGSKLRARFLLILILLTPSLSKRPNIVIVLCDDLDSQVGGANASTLKYTHQWFQESNGILPNWFVHTPVCCPSRAQLWTGKMFHNLRTQHAGHEGCMHVNVNATASSPFYAHDYFAPHFRKLNYTVGFFGKHLNTQNPTDFIPDGVDQWLVNGGGAYLNPSFTWASRGSDPVPINFDNCSQSTGMPCYSTSVIGNASLAWIQRHVQSSPLQPFLAVISVKAPHLQDGPGFPMSIPAPWYENASITEQKAPRTQNYNLSCPDHHWLVRSQPPLTKKQGEMVDQLFTSRLKTLLSVDDLMIQLVSTLKDLQMLNETIVVFTSDNGYRLGQFRMPQGKFHAYETDIRVPMMIRGPNVKPKPSLVGTHVDLIPTFLGLALEDSSQAIVPNTMDGTNLAAAILPSGSALNHVPTKKSLLIEYMSLGNVVRYQHLEDTYNHTFLALRILDPNAKEEGLRNLKYVEYRDSREDWNCSKPPLEVELFDLERDELEMHNLAETASPLLLQALSMKTLRMFHCKGESCRKEQRRALF